MEMYVILLLMHRDEHNLEPYIETKPRVRHFQWEKKKKLIQREACPKKNQQVWHGLFIL